MRPGRRSRLEWQPCGRLAAIATVLAAVISTSCSGSSESAFCREVGAWFEAYRDDMSMGEAMDWWAEASEVRDVAPDEIHEDLDLLISAGRAWQEMMAGDGDMSDLPDVAPGRIDRASERIAAKGAEICAPN